MKILYESTRIENKKYNEKLNNAMHKYGWVLDKYGGGGVWYVCPLSEFQVWSFFI